MNIMVVNIGNSRTAAGWYRRDKVRRSAWTETETPVILEAVANGEVPDVIFLSSVVPKSNRAWTRLLRATFPRVPHIWMDHRLDMGIKVDLKRPDQTGHDRFANAVAGADLVGAPCIVCDFGTATTFNVVLPRRGFVGGAIVPGYGLWFEALGGLAQLPHLTPRKIQVTTGRNTEEAIRLGAQWGYRGMIMEVLQRLKRACGRNEPNLCATGGHAKAVMRHTGLKIPVRPDLTLHGLAKICERNVVEV